MLGKAAAHARALGVSVVLGAVASCTHPASAPATVHVIGTDYAFAMPDSVSAGPTVITFENRGKQRHEAVFVRLKPGVTLRQFADSVARDAPVRPLRATGSAVLFADPGSRNDVVSIRINFKRGEHWALSCQFADSAGAPKHQKLGMFRLVTVR